jgi:prepilin-type N-terminal cleavage/methylation domain-containing protein
MKLAKRVKAMAIKKKAFTLVELLVVISIIALLLAILMPALSKVREQAKNVVCGSQLRQQGIAMLAYASDNRVYPHAVGRFDASGNLLTPFFPMTTTWSNDGVTYNPAGQAVLFDGGYIKDPSFFFCPAISKNATGLVIKYDPRQFQKDPSTGKVNWFNVVFGYCYWAGGYKCLIASYDANLLKATAQSPNSRSDTVMIADLITTWPSSGGSYAGIEKKSIWSNHVRGGIISGGNIIRNDNSVVWSPFKDMQRDMQSGQRTRLRAIINSNVYFWF